MAFTVSYERFLSEADEFLQRSDRLRDSWERRSLMVDPATNECVQFLAKKCAVAFPRKRDDQPSEEETDALVGIEPFDADNEDDQACVSSTFRTPLPSESEEEARTPVVVLCEYHVIYSLSYRVPVLYFTASYSNGRLVSLAELWKLLPAGQVCGCSGRRDILTQTEHPLLQRPFYCLHPCNTAKAMREVLGCFPSRSSSSLGHVCDACPTGCDANSSSFVPCDATDKVPGERSLPDTAGANYLVTWLSMFGPVAGLQVSAEYSKSL